MIRIDDSLLEELGLGELRGEHRSALLRGVYEELRARVGIVLCDRFSDEQLDQFSALVESGDDAAAHAFLATHAPDHAEVVRGEFAQLREAVAGAAPRLLNAVGVTDRNAARLRPRSQREHKAALATPCPASSDRAARARPMGLPET